MKMRSFFAVFAVAAIAQVSAFAEVITFTFNLSDNGSEIITKTEGGLTLTLQDADSEGGWFGAQAGGLMLAQNYGTAQTAFTLQFDKEVSLLSYTITSGAGGNFDLYSDDGSLSGNLLSVGTHSFGSLILNAETFVYLTGNVSPTGAYALIQSISVEVVPEPSSILLLSGALVGGLIAFRRMKKDVA